MQANKPFFLQPTSPPSSSSTYRVNATNGNTCILIQTDGLLSIQYRDKLNEDREADIYLPDYPGLTGWLDKLNERSEDRITISFQELVITLTRHSWQCHFEDSSWLCTLRRLQVSTRYSLISIIKRIRFRRRTVVRESGWTFVLNFKSNFWAYRSTQSECKAINAPTYVPFSYAHWKIIWVYAGKNRCDVRSGNWLIMSQS